MVWRRPDGRKPRFDLLKRKAFVLKGLSAFFIVFLFVFFPFVGLLLGVISVLATLFNLNNLLIAPVCLPAIHIVK